MVIKEYRYLAKANLVYTAKDNAVNNLTNPLVPLIYYNPIETSLVRQHFNNLGLVCTESGCKECNKG